MRKRLLISAVVLVVLVAVAVPFALFLWPVQDLRLGVSAGDRVDADIAKGYPVALARTRSVEELLRRRHPELASPWTSWQQVSCSIEDWSAQLAVADYAQVCELETFWVVPTRHGPRNDCLDVDQGAIGDDVSYSVIRTRSSQLRPGTDDCWPFDRGSGLQLGELRTTVVHGHRPSGFGNTGKLLVISVTSSLSSTMIGCHPAWPFCRSSFSTPRMDAVAALRNS